MFNLYSDYDILQKLSAVYTRYVNDPFKRVTRNFEHPFLGRFLWLRTANREDPAAIMNKEKERPKESWAFKN